MNNMYCVLIAIIVAALGYAFGYMVSRRNYIRDTHSVGTLLIIVDEADGKRYPMLELNNDEDLWKLKTNDVAYFVVKRKG